MKNHFRKSFSLVEVIIVIAIFALVFASILIFSIDAQQFSKINAQTIQAGFVIQEELNAILINKQELWGTMVQNTNEGDKHISFSNNRYAIADGTKTVGNLTVGFQVNSVYRDENMQIVQSGGTEDLNTRVINFTAQWIDDLGNPLSISESTYVSNWNTPNWKLSSQSDFNQGTMSGTIVTATGDGALELDLDSTVQADWCIPYITLTTYNLARQGVPTSIHSIPNYAYLGTGGNASGPAFDHVNISSDDPPIVTQLQTYSSSIKVNDIFGDDRYAYLATDSNSKEVIIIDTQVTPYAEIGSFDASTSVDADSVWVLDNKGYLIQGDKLRVFDLSSKTGSRPSLGSFTLVKNGTDIVVKGNYAYVTISGSATEMQIINISNPSLMVAVGSADTNSQAGISVFINDDASRAYIATQQSSSQKEVFIIDISNKTGVRPIVNSVDTNGMSPSQVSVIAERIIVAGIGGEEYQVFDISNELSISKCGGVQVNSGIKGLSTLFDAEGTGWAYVLTQDSSAELIMIKGGDFGGGGGGGTGDEYLSYGEYTSTVFDTGSANTQYYGIGWDAILFEFTELKVQVRAGSTSNLNALPWIGPDGTSASYFTLGSGEYLPANIQNNRYIQFHAEFFSDRVNTPILDTIKINYQN